MVVICTEPVPFTAGIICSAYGAFAILFCYACLFLFWRKPVSCGATFSPVRLDFIWISLRPSAQTLPYSVGMPLPVPLYADTVGQNLWVNYLQLVLHEQR